MALLAMSAIVLASGIAENLTHTSTPPAVARHRWQGVR
jgi:hypothetical protein